MLAFAGTRANNPRAVPFSRGHPNRILQCNLLYHTCGVHVAHAPIVAKPLLKKKPAARVYGFPKFTRHACGVHAAHAPIVARPLLKKKPAARICGFLQSLCHTCGGALVPGGHRLAPTEPAGETAAHAPIAAEAVPGSQPAARANTISNLLYHTCGGMTNTIFLFQPSPVCYEKNPRPTKARGAGIIR